MLPISRTSAGFHAVEDMVFWDSGGTSDVMLRLQL